MVMVMMMTTTTTYSDFIDNAITMNRNDHEQISVYLENFTRCSNQYSHKTFRILPYCLFVYLAPLLVVLVNFAYLSQVSIIPRGIPTPHSVILSYLPNGVPIPLYTRPVPSPFHILSQLFGALHRSLPI